MKLPFQKSLLNLKGLQLYASTVTKNFVQVSQCPNHIVILFYEASKLSSRSKAVSLERFLLNFSFLGHDPFGT